MGRTIREVLKFEIKVAASRSIDKAQRIALMPLFPSTERGQIEDAESSHAETAKDATLRIGKAVLAVQLAWRARMVALRRQGWMRFADPTDWWFGVNCPPVSVLTNKYDLRPCREYQVCPFCWCRYYVQQLYLAMEYAFYGTNRISWLDPALKGCEKYEPLFSDLVVTTNTWWYPVKDWSLEEILGTIKTERYARRPLRRKPRFGDENRATPNEPPLPNVGNFTLNTVEPGTREKDDHWPFWRRMERNVYIICPGENDPPKEISHPSVDCTRTVRRLFSGGRTELGLAAGLACAYPVGMMRGPAAMVAAVMEARHGVQMSSYTGVLRNRQRRKRAQKELGRDYVEHFSPKTPEEQDGEAVD